MLVIVQQTSIERRERYASPKRCSIIFVGRKLPIAVVDVQVEILEDRVVKAGHRLPAPTRVITTHERKAVGRIELDVGTSDAGTGTKGEVPIRGQMDIIGGVEEAGQIVDVAARADAAKSIGRTAGVMLRVTNLSFKPDAVCQPITETTRDQSAIIGSGDHIGAARFKLCVKVSEVVPAAAQSQIPARCGSRGGSAANHQCCNSP